MLADGIGVSFLIQIIHSVLLYRTENYISYHTIFNMTSHNGKEY